ncbi:hypothetical protein [Xanthomonas fragariae]|uniref:hypothetical protein n=1 Tax=Xanthomonas fragariae TaxID=48664 RepID=UPI003530A429
MDIGSVHWKLQPPDLLRTHRYAGGCFLSWLAPSSDLRAFVFRAVIVCIVRYGIVPGRVGALLVQPLTVVSFVLIKHLYVQEALDTPIAIAGQKQT